MATQLASKICNSLKGKPIQGRIVQGREPPQFIALFQPMVVLKGGISPSYKKFIADKNSNDDTYASDGIALIQISGTSVHNNKVIQVDALATSLSSTNSFLLQSGNSMFLWHGNSSTFEQQQWAAKVAEFLKPGVVLKHSKEGTESSAFWFALGGKQNYSPKKAAQEIVRDPHLYVSSFNKGKLEITEVFNFSQDDLLTEDILILDTHEEVFVWVGQSVASSEKQNAFDIGQRYIELAVALEGLSPDVPLYKVTEGNEPCFFTTYFSWDGTKATVQGNSFQKKVALLFGAALHSSESGDKSNNSNHGGPTQRASALAALSSAFNPSSTTKTAVPKPVRSGQGSQRAAAVAALSTVLTAEQKRGMSDTTAKRFSRSPSPDPVLVDGRKSEELGDPKSEETEDTKSEEAVDTKPEDPVDLPENSSEEVVEERLSTSAISEADSQTDEPIGKQTFRYEQLNTKSSNPAQGIDLKKREEYLSDEEFQTVFGMPKEEFYRQPKWKRDMQKKKVELF